MLEIADVALVLALPARHRHVEDGPRLGDVVAHQLDPAGLADGAVEAVRADRPGGAQLVPLALVLDRRHHAVAVRRQLDQPFGAPHRSPCAARYSLRIASVTSSERPTLNG